MALNIWVLHPTANTAEGHMAPHRGRSYLKAVSMLAETAGQGACQPVQAWNTRPDGLLGPLGNAPSQTVESGDGPGSSTSSPESPFLLRLNKNGSRRGVLEAI